MKYSLLRMRWDFLWLCVRRARPRKSLYFFLRILWKRALFTIFRKFLGETLTSPEGLKIFNIHSLINYWGIFIVKELEGPWERFIRETPSPVVCDVGSNIGFFRAYVLDLNPGAIVYTFDPQPEMSDYVPRALHHVTALGSKAGMVPLVVSCGWTASTEGNYYKGDIKLVPCIPLKDLHYPHIHLLKIDVDGGELEVLKGVDPICCIDYILVETLQIEEIKLLFPGRCWTKKGVMDWTGELL